LTLNGRTHGKPKKMPIRVVLALALGLALASAAPSRFSAEKKPQDKKGEKDRTVKQIAPRFVAEKFGVKEGDTVPDETAKMIHDEAQKLGERPPNFFS